MTKTEQQDIKLKDQIADLKADVEGYRGLYAKANNDNSMLKDKAELFERGKNAEINALNDQIHGLREIIKWQINPETAHSLCEECRPF